MACGSTFTRASVGRDRFRKSTATRECGRVSRGREKGRGKAGQRRRGGRGRRKRGKRTKNEGASREPKHTSERELKVKCSRKKVWRTASRPLLSFPLDQLGPMNRSPALRRVVRVRRPSEVDGARRRRHMGSTKDETLTEKELPLRPSASTRESPEIAPRLKPPAPPKRCRRRDGEGKEKGREGSEDRSPLPLSTPLPRVRCSRNCRSSEKGEKGRGGRVWKAQGFKGPPSSSRCQR